MNKREDLHIELFKESSNNFKYHLSVDGNDRIIFSGRFGTGKTTFINEFFKGDNQQLYFGNEKLFNVVKLFPVNYSIASNEDIFRYIKHDVIFELLISTDEYAEEVKSYIDTAPKFILNNIHKIFASLISMVPVVGKDVITGFQMLDKLREEFLKEHDSLNRSGNELQNLIEYVDTIKNTESSIYEDDFITKLIQRILERKIKYDGYSENILVIDDLDRVDPDHIFRILNIFSAHFDRTDPTSKKHKFGFDKIILVCDIQNVREIFKARFGGRADFNGYIDKFYSHRIFHFTNREELYKISRSIIYNSDWASTENGLGYNNTLDTFRSYFDNNSTFLYDMMLLLIENGQLQLRNILKFRTKHITFMSYIKINSDVIDVFKDPFIFNLMVLTQIKGDVYSLRDAINECFVPVQFLGKASEYILELLKLIELKNYKGHDSISIPVQLPSGIVSLMKEQNSISIRYQGQTHPQFSHEDLIYCLRRAIGLIEISKITV